MSGSVIRKLLAWTLLLSPAPLAAQRPKEDWKPRTPAVKVPSVSLARVLTIGRTEATIGVEDEEGPYLLSASIGLAVGGDGTLYASEYPDGTIKAFDPTGRHLGTFGRRGRGPGEFINPIAMLHDGDSTLYAAQGEFGITEMTAKQGRLAYRRSFGVGSRFRTLCLMGDSLVAAGWVDGRMIHFLGRDGAPVRAFGAGWSTDTIERVRETANRAAGTLACDDRSGRMVLTQAGGPRIRSYARDGTLLWERELPDFRHTFYVAQGDNSIATGWGDDAVENAIVLPRDRLLVQVFRRDFATAPRVRSPSGLVMPDVVRRIAYVLDARTGAILTRSDAKESLGLLHGTTSYLVGVDPYPTIKRRTITFIP
jgi:outer membrane protein assembly factor BamB